MMSLM